MPAIEIGLALVSFVALCASWFVLPSEAVPAPVRGPVAADPIATAA